MKGIVLAGGHGTRLHPLTAVSSKQLLPVYDKPMIYYPLSVLMLAGIREVLIITTPRDADAFERLLGTGAQYGLSIQYAMQSDPRGIADALLIGEKFIAGGTVALILGDNVLYGTDLPILLRDEVAKLDGATLFGYRVSRPEQYGVAVRDGNGRLVDVVEKPRNPPSNVAITGLYLYDAHASRYAAGLMPSPRGELEITDLNRCYIRDGRARLVQLGRGTAWLDTGTPESLLQAATYVSVLQRRQGVQIACLEEVAYRMGLIDVHQLRGFIRSSISDELAHYLSGLVDQ